MSTQGPSQRNYLVQSIPFIFGLSVLIVVALLAPLQATLSSFFLFGAWMSNLYLKSSLGFGKDTSFADLNFTAVVFAVSRFVNLISDGYDSQAPTLLLQTLIFIFIIGFSWVINLHISREISNQNPFFTTTVTVGGVSWFASGFLSFASVIALIILQEIGII